MKSASAQVTVTDNVDESRILVRESSDMILVCGLDYQGKPEGEVIYVPAHMADATADAIKLVADSIRRKVAP